MSTRWPFHLSASNQVDMNVIDGLLSVFTFIDNDPIAISESLFFCYVIDLHKHVS